MGWPRCFRQEYVLCFPNINLLYENLGGPFWSQDSNFNKPGINEQPSNKNPRQVVIHKNLVYVSLNVI